MPKPIWKHLFCRRHERRTQLYRWVWEGGKSAHRANVPTDLPTCLRDHPISQTIPPWNGSPHLARRRTLPFSIYCQLLHHLAWVEYPETLAKGPPKTESTVATNPLTFQEEQEVQSLLSFKPGSRSFPNSPTPLKPKQCGIKSLFSSPSFHWSTFSMLFPPTLYVYHFCFILKAIAFGDPRQAQWVLFGCKSTVLQRTGGPRSWVSWQVT